MPVKSKMTAKLDAVKAKADQSAVKVKKTTMEKSAANEKTVARGSVKPVASKNGPNPKTVVPADTKPAAISAQKHATVVKVAKPNQQRISMAPPSKAAPAQKTTAKAAPAKVVAATKPATVKAVVPAKPVSAPKAAAAAKVIAKPAAPVKAIAKAAPTAKPAATEAKPATTPTLDAAQFQARQAAQQHKPAQGRAMPASVANPAAQRISVPAAAPAAVVTPKDLAQKAQQAQQAQQALVAKKPVNIRHGFKTNEWIVYPAHGVGRIVAIEEQEIAGMALELFVITFEKDKMTLRVPTGKSASVGMRKLAEEGVVKRAMETLKGKARIKRTMWSRRAQEFEQKINSGDLVSIAEVVRDLFRAETQPEQSYSERQLYEAALDRMAREIAAVEKIDERGAVQRVTEVLSKSAKTRRAESGDATGGDIKAA